jgi:uncharacterized protein YkwD
MQNRVKLMRAIKKYMILICTLLFACGYTTAQSGADITYADVIQVINELRSNPKAFIPEIDKYVSFWKSFVPNKKTLEKAGEEAKSRLLKQLPLSILTVDSGLVAASNKHVRDGELSGVLGHIGSDNSNPATRAAEYGWYSSISECITYNQTTASRVVAAFIVDENTPDRGHRESLLNPTFTVIGAGTGYHPKYDVQCVVMLGTQ